MLPADYNLDLLDTSSDYESWSITDYEATIPTYYYEDPEALQKMSITLYCITFVFGIIGNGLVIWIAGFRMKKTISAVWFLNLAIADFLCCASLLLRIAEWADHESEFPDTFCILNIALFSITMTSSVLLLTAMSIDRCVSIMWPFWAKVHRTRRLVRITAGVIWGFSLLLTSVLIYLKQFYSLSLDEWCLSYSQNSFDFMRINEAIRLFRLVMMFVIPFIIVLTSYLIIFLTVRKSKRSQKSQRPYRIITAVILCFFICWFPYYIWPLTPMYDEGDFPFYTVNIIITNLAYLNSCINPIIYVFMGQDFRQCFLRSIPARVERALSEYPDDPNKEQDDHEHTCTTDV